MAGDEKKVCGIVMPIGAMPGCPETHWAEVRSILDDAITNAGFTPNLVSDGTDVGVIQKRIVQNLYDNPIVVCDVSQKNPNVMFELGLRLAFDKPTIIVKDDDTSYSFDTSPIEHLTYPKDLRFAKIVDFKAKLAEKIKGTSEKAAGDQSYTTFLGHFGTFIVAKLDKKEVPEQEYVLQELRNLSASIRRIEARSGAGVSDADQKRYGASNTELMLMVPTATDEDSDRIKKIVDRFVVGPYSVRKANNFTRIIFDMATPPNSVHDMLNALRDGGFAVNQVHFANS